MNIEPRNYREGTQVTIRQSSIHYGQHSGVGKIYQVHDRKENPWYDVRWPDGYDNSYTHKELDMIPRDNEDALRDLPSFFLME